MTGRSELQRRAEDPFAALRGIAPLAGRPRLTHAAQPDPAQVSARRRRRPVDLVDAVRGLDTQTDTAALTQWLAWIDQTYHVSDCGLLLGLFAHCYLGPRHSDGQPYLDHRLDLTQGILAHYTALDTVPPGFEPARPLARSEAYAYIEVFSDGAVVPVYPDGRPA